MAFADQHDGVDVRGNRRVARAQRFGELALQWREPELVIRLVTKDKLHGPMTQPALTVVEDDRLVRYRLGRARGLGNGHVFTLSLAMKSHACNRYRRLHEVGPT